MTCTCKVERTEVTVSEKIGETTTARTSVTVKRVVDASCPEHGGATMLEIPDPLACLKAAWPAFEWPEWPWRKRP